MNVLIVIEYFLPHIGGVEVVFKNLAQGLADKGHEVTVITQRLEGTKAEELMGRDNKYEVIRISSLKSRYVFSFSAIPKVMELAKHADIIHTTTYNGALPAKIASFFRKKKCVITVHEILGKAWKDSMNMNRINAAFHRFIERMIMAVGFDRYICVSDSTKKQVLAAKVKKEKVITIHNGMDYDFFDSEKYDSSKVRKKFGIKDEFVYFGYGRPGITKGFEYLIRAVPFIAKTIPNSKLVLILSKSPYDRYVMMKDLIKALGVEKDVILVDPVKREELPNYLKTADCVVVPSLTEGFGFTVAESCAMGKPVVASNTTSIPEVISGSHVLVKPKSAREIAEGVIKVYKKKADYKPLKKFSWKQAVDEYEKVYKELTSK